MLTFSALLDFLRIYADEYGIGESTENFIKFIRKISDTCNNDLIEYYNLSGDCNVNVICKAFLALQAHTGTAYNFNFNVDDLFNVSTFQARMMMCILQSSITVEEYYLLCNECLEFVLEPYVEKYIEKAIAILSDKAMYSSEEDVLFEVN